MLIRVPKGWEIPEREATPESVYMERRRFLKGLGALAVGASLACRSGDGLGAAGSAAGDAAPPYTDGFPGDVARLYPAERNEAYAGGRPLTEEAVAAKYNNFYEFTESKSGVARMSASLVTRPWSVEIAGLVEEPRTLDVDEIVRAMGLEERIYRLRCVEAWAMTVPWTGFPLGKFVEHCRPLGAARYVRFLTFLRPEEAFGQKKPWYPWPYHEALRMDEATNELAMLATGIYGHPLPPQHGAPIRLVVPWKYGYKSIKSIVKIEFTSERPATFWTSLTPSEYDFAANVDPGVPHPRWSQAAERLLGGSERVPTLLYNGYADQVAGLYTA